jgi:hypothetical protein
LVKLINLFVTLVDLIYILETAIIHFYANYHVFTAWYVGIEMQEWMKLVKLKRMY